MAKSEQEQKKFCRSCKSCEGCDGCDGTQCLVELGEPCTAET